MQWFRRARPADASWNVAKTALQVVLFWGLFLFVIPPVIVDAASAVGYPPRPTAFLRMVGVTLFAVASALGLLSAFTMAFHGAGTPLPLDAPRALVVLTVRVGAKSDGAAGLTQGIALALWHGSIAIVGYVIAGGVLWHVAVRPFEEVDLARQFGSAFFDTSIACLSGCRGAHNARARPLASNLQDTNERSRNQSYTADARSDHGRHGGGRLHDGVRAQNWRAAVGARCIKAGRPSPQNSARERVSALPGCCRA